jgi:ribonucleoside-triphosphate reductase
MKVKKRDGAIVSFDQNKIIDAVLAAFKEVDGELSDYAYAKAGNIADFIQEQVEKADHILDIEEIQDYVERGLMSTKKKDVARAYITYRDTRNRMRGGLTDKTLLEYLSGKSKYWNEENSNKDSLVVTTQRDYIAGITSTDIARRFLLPQDVCEAHDQGIIHQHK